MYRGLQPVGPYLHFALCANNEMRESPLYTELGSGETKLRYPNAAAQGG